MRRSAALIALALVLTGCAAAEEPGASASSPGPASTSSSTGPGSPESAEESAEEGSAEEQTVVEVSIAGDRVEPNSEHVELAAGEELVLEVTSDRAAEFHVHSSPEQVLEAPAGTSRHPLTIERPGVVDVEEHESGIVILQLEVR